MRNDEDIVSEWSAARGFLLALGVLVAGVLGSCMAVVRAAVSP